MYIKLVQHSRSLQDMVLQKYDTRNDSSKLREEFSQMEMLGGKRYSKCT